MGLSQASSKKQRQHELTVEELGEWEARVRMYPDESAQKDREKERMREYRELMAAGITVMVPGNKEGDK